MQALSEASTQLGKRREYSDSTMLAHYCGLILDQLTADQSVDRGIMIKLEWTYFGVLQSSDRDVNLLEAALAESPEFFLTVVSSVYRGDDDNDNDVDIEEVARRSAIAEQSYTLLDKWSRVPGTDDAGSIDAAALGEWVRRARELAVSAKRVDIVDQQIGTILSATAPEPNGDWPPKPVRDVIERVKSKELKVGFRVGTRNRRGVTTRGPLDGGELERDLKSRYGALAKKFRVSSPRTLPSSVRSAPTTISTPSTWTNYQMP